MHSGLFKAILLEDAKESLWTSAYTEKELLDLISAATPEQINYIPTEGEHAGKSVLWLVAKDSAFWIDEQYRVFEYLLSLSNNDAINAVAKTYDIGRNEHDYGSSVLSLVAQANSCPRFRQFKLIATLLEKGARIDAESEKHLFHKIRKIYLSAIKSIVKDHFNDCIELNERIARIKAVHDNCAFILANLSALCARYIIDEVFYTNDGIEIALFLRLAVNDFVNGVFTVVNNTLSSYADSLERDDKNTLRELLQMFASDQGKVLLNYVNNTTVLSHELLSTLQQRVASDREQNRVRFTMHG